MENSKGYVAFHLGESEEDVFVEISIPVDQPHEEIKTKMLRLLYGINSGAFIEDCASCLIEHGASSGQSELCSEIVADWRDLILEYIKEADDETNRALTDPCVKPTQVFRSRIS